MLEAMHTAIESPRRTWVVAVTGGIASGKSAVTERFAEHGVAVYDADVAARQVVAPGSEGLAELVQAFGQDILDGSGHLDRRAMRRRVFDDAHARACLEHIVHPRVHAWLRQQVEHDPGPYCLLSIPLLAESWPRYAWVDHVLVVEAPRDLRRQRLMRRDGIDAPLAERMLAAQASADARRAIADDIIHNLTDLAALQAQVDALDQRYRELAGAASRTGGNSS